MATERPTRQFEKLPSRINLNDPKEVDSIPDDPFKWQSEMKLRGIHVAIFIEKKGTIRIVTGSNMDITDQFMDLRQGFEHLSRYHQVLIEADIVVGEGRTKDEAEQVNRRLNASGQKRTILSNTIPAGLITTDLLFLDGQDLRSEPLMERKSRLSHLMSDFLAEKFDFVENVSTKNHKQLLEDASSKGFPEILIKKSDSPYSYFGRRHWLRLRAEKP